MIVIDLIFLCLALRYHLERKKTYYHVLFVHCVIPSKIGEHKFEFFSYFLNLYSTINLVVSCCVYFHGSCYAASTGYPYPFRFEWTLTAW